MSTTTTKTESRARRHGRIRSRVIGTEARPRLSVFRSNRFIYAQLINDETGKTLVAADSRKAKAKSALERATEVGTMLAELAKGKGITQVVFDRGGFRYQGAIAALADGAREAGLSF